MKALLIFPVILTATAFATPPTDPNLSEKVDRSLKKVPTFHAKSPTYALAVLGQEASHQSWIVFDLEKAANRTLTGSIYIDLNNDRDLTQLNEKITLPKPQNGSYYQTKKVNFTDTDGTPNGYAIKIVAANHSETAADPLHFRIFVYTPKGDRFGAWGDQNSDLIPASTPEKAPVLHFDGPRQMGFEVPTPLSFRNGNWGLDAGVGSYGLGDGSFVYQFYKTIPKDVHPTATIAWPALKKGDPPKLSKFTLKDRC